MPNSTYSAPIRAWYLTAWLLVACACSGCVDAPGRGDAPVVADAVAANGGSVVLITVDGLVARELSAFGGDAPTPNLARLVAAGRQWTGWTASPVTRPAVGTYLTGLPPHDHGIWNNVYTSLRAGTPTLATVLAAAGYRTAAFPDSSHVGYASGLLDDFQVVDDPPAAPTSVLRWAPAIKDPAAQADNFASWLDTVPTETPFFAWLHSSGPFMRRFAALDQPAGPIEPFDAMIGRVFDAATARDATVILVGTYAAAAGQDDTLPGPGMNIDERSIAVPFVVVGADVATWTAGAKRVAAIDVAATVAALTGVTLGSADARSLGGDAPAGRAIFSFSRAPRDQFGWLPLGAASQGDASVFVGGASEDASGDAATVGQLRQAVARHMPPPPSFDAMAEVTALLERSGITPNAAPAAGRNVSDRTRRMAVARAVWDARVALYRQEWQRAMGALDAALGADPEALTPLLDRGQLMVFTGQPQRGHELVARATEIYPADVETVHWYAHSIWSEHLDVAEPLLAAILPERPQDPDLLYDMACARVLGGDLDAGETFLRDAIASGYRDWEHMETDADLRAYRESGRFAVLMREYRQ